VDKIDNPYLVIILVRTPKFEWCVVWCGFQNGYQKCLCSKKLDMVYDKHPRLNSQQNKGDLR
jgi:hypothetical protein